MAILLERAAGRSLGRYDTERLTCGEIASANGSTETLGRTLHLDDPFHLTCFNICCDAKRTNIGACPRFEINRLPDAAGSRVPVDLFAGGLLFVGVIDCSDDNGGLLAGFGERREVQLEGDISADVFF